MKVLGDYHRDGYAHLEGLVPPEVAQAFLQSLKQDMGPGPIPLSRAAGHVNLLTRPAFEVYGHHYKPMLHFLWGLTPVVGEVVGRALLPTYDYLRIYRSGDVCRVHSDRYSCEHSLSLTLGYSDGHVWPLDVEKARSEPSAKVEPDFGAEAFSSVALEVGDALLYQGVNHRHGRTVPNPNRWSVHLFLHWVDRDGPYRDHAFDGQLKPAPVDFSFS
ncbi:MAG TPA: hypothetical protein VEA60_14740 [Allosphingosinicella sp.]|nr:hypothetical protein [Allosphingosinicella sp.]